ncbi:hypothetical protein [Limimaricola cinnabarinus]|uniref:hypothetical protein n=1 Tax=Limimaricola cinnabarinus TaxID=1125964 RepID=UPI0024909020|nr:hypothetical protein [Limimaricola cinnabarinus]
MAMRLRQLGHAFRRKQGRLLRIAHRPDGAVIAVVQWTTRGDGGEIESHVLGRRIERPPADTAPDQNDFDIPFGG